MYIKLLLSACALLLTLCSFADLAHAARIIRDMCNQTSGDGQGQSCPGANDLLIRPKYSDGTCGDWMCCPPNGDGTYDCTRATNPTRTMVPGRLKGLLGSRATVLSPTPGAGSQIQPMFKGQHAPILRRGIEGDSAPSSPTVPEEGDK